MLHAVGDAAITAAVTAAMLLLLLLQAARSGTLAPWVAT
jgi:hypothetical protein